jgi:hypothetical protein
MVSDPVKANHEGSNTVAIPHGFLTGPSPSAPLVVKHIDFASSALPEFAGSVAFTIDDVLSPQECAQLIRLAEASVPLADEGASPWQPAMISLAKGVEASAPDYRNCGRIMWDSPALSQRIWERIAQAEGVKDMLLEVVPEGSLDGQRWDFERLNERMRFLQYHEGQYFKGSLASQFACLLDFRLITEAAHHDGPTYFEIGDTEYMSHYTVQLYLNDSAATSSTGGGVVGGATAFLSRKQDRRVDVNPKAGSVIIFQHANLRHEGSVVVKGVKYSMRTDILYKWVDELVVKRKK